MSFLNPTLTQHILSVCEDNQIQAYIATPDARILRNISEMDLDGQSVTVYFLPKEVSQNFLVEAALLLPLMGGIFDKQLKDFSFNHLGLEKATPVKIAETTYNVQFLPLYSLVRLVSKGELTAALAVLHNHHAFNEGGQQLIEILKELAINISSKAICDNIASEIVLMANAFARMRIVSHRQCMETMYGYAFLKEYKRCGFKLQDVNVSKEQLLADNPIVRLMEQTQIDYPNFSEVAYVKVSAHHFNIYSALLKGIMDWLIKEQNSLSFPEKDLPVETFFKRFTKFIKQEIRLT